MMAGIQLYSFQVDALNKMKNGCILNGDVGSGKSRTSLAYFYTLYGGSIGTKNYVRMINPCDLYIITTAQKRDKKEWEQELNYYYMSENSELNIYKNKIVVDSWNNISKYVDVKSSFFIFDEQRVVGKGAWVKSFLKISKNNKWILLSATPGDKWEDYVPVFIANGFFKNFSQFNREHAIFSPFVNFPRIERYINEGPLIKMKKSILIPMKCDKKTVPLHNHILCNYNKNDYDYVVKNRWNIFTNKPIETASEYCQVLRRIVNSDLSRQEAVLDLVKKHKECIIFYNYDYELDILRKLFENYNCFEWNGHKHDMLPMYEKWVYLVQYSAGNEGWNCITCDAMIFYSQNYSYKQMKQAAGRIDRLNTPFINLYYYHLKTDARIDKQISLALNRKKKFNERDFAPVFEKKMEDKEK